MDYNKKYRKKAGESFLAFFLFEFVEVLLINVGLGLLHQTGLGPRICYEACQKWGTSNYKG